MALGKSHHISEPRLSATWGEQEKPLGPSRVLLSLFIPVRGCVLGRRGHPLWVRPLGLWGCSDSLESPPSSRRVPGSHGKQMLACVPSSPLPGPTPTPPGPLRLPAGNAQEGLQLPLLAPEAPGILGAVPAAASSPTPPGPAHSRCSGGGGWSQW